MTRWLNDTEILRGIEYTISFRVGNPWYAVTAHEHQHIERSGHMFEHPNMLSECPNIRGLLIPTHVSGIHWALLLVNFETNVVTYYDSAAYSDCQLFNAWLPIMSAVTERRNACMDGPPISESDWDLIFEDQPRQLNGNDCGVFVYMRARKAITGEEFDNRPETVLQARRIIDRIVTERT